MIAARLQKLGDKIEDNCYPLNIGNENQTWNVAYPVENP
jgi:hypothetical protein